MQTRTLFFFAVVALTVGACGDSPVTPPVEAFRMFAVTPNNFIGVAGIALDVRPEVRVYQGQQPVAGVTVDFSVTAPIPAGVGGYVQVTRVVTDRLGSAKPGAWVLGDTPGINELTASTTDRQEVKFKALALPAIAEASRRYVLLDIGGMLDPWGTRTEGAYELDEQNRFVSRLSWLCDETSRTCGNVSVGTADFREDQIVFDYAAPWLYADGGREVASIKGDTLLFERAEHSDDCVFCRFAWRYVRRH